MNVSGGKKEGLKENGGREGGLESGGKAWGTGETASSK